MTQETRTIWKYEIKSCPQVKLQMPVGAKILALQTQASRACIWALVWPHIETEDRSFVIYGTGHAIPADCGEYVGTFQELDGALVLHLFETTKVTQ